MSGSSIFFATQAATARAARAGLMARTVSNFKPGWKSQAVEYQLQTILLSLYTPVA
jgi:hypothetical protein